MSPPSTARRTPVLPQFLALAAVWGSSFLFIKVGLDGLSPAQVVLGRLLAGAVALLLVCGLRRQPLPRDRTVWLHLAAVSVLLSVAPFLLFAWAERHVTSSLASIDNATTPLMTTAVALLALPAERPTRARAAGLLVGFLGVLLVLGPWRGLGAGQASGQLACLAATASYGCGFVYLRRFVSPYGLAALPAAALQVGIGAAVMVVLSPFVATSPVRLSPAVVGSILALGVLGTGLAYVWNTNVVTGWGATNASSVTYLTPLVGVLLGVLVLGETPAWNQPVGALVVVVGIALTQERFG